MSNLDALVTQALSGELGVEQLGAAFEELGLDEMGAEELAAELGVSVEELGAALAKKVSTAARPAARPAARAAARPAARPATSGFSLDQIKRIVAQEVEARTKGGYGILAPDLNAQGAFGMKGSMAIVTFTQSVAAGATVQIPKACDRDCVIREIWCPPSNADLLITDFKAGGIPFVGFQFPISLARFTSQSFHHEVRAASFKTSQQFLLTVNNPTNAAITAQIELWGTAS